MGIIKMVSWFAPGGNLRQHFISKPKKAANLQNFHKLAPRIAPQTPRGHRFGAKKGQEKLLARLVQKSAANLHTR